MTAVLDIDTNAVTTVIPVVSAANAERSTVATYGPRVGWSLVALFVGFCGEQVWAGSLTVPGANLAAIILIISGLAGICWIWSHKADPPTWVQLGLLAALAVGISFQAAVIWLFDPSYGTDAVAFDQYAAWLALHGANPYTHSMEPSLNMFHVPSIYHTYRLDGTALDALSYPAGSFLLYMPLLALGVDMQAANIVDLGFWFAGMFILWRVLPRDVRWAAGLVGAAGMYVGFAVGGLTDMLFVPFVLLAVYRWDRFADPANRAWTRWVGPFALGIAASIKQTPWFLGPYLLLGLYFEATAHGVNPWKVVARYLGVVAGVFAVVNAAFIVVDPVAWFEGALVPFLEPTIPDGQGLVNLLVYERTGGGNLTWFSVAGLGFVLLTLVAFTLCYRTLKRSWVVLIGISFFLPTRSFGSYLFMMIPAALVAASTVRPASANPFPALNRRARPVLAAGAAGVLAAAGLAVTTPSPMQLRVVGTRSTGQLQTLNQLTVEVRNRTGEVVRPHFTVNASGHATTFWYPRNAKGTFDVVLGPHQTQTVTLQAPNSASMPSVAEPVAVEAFTATPASISVSPRYLVSPVNTRIMPDAVNTPVPVGQPVILTVQLENHYGAPIHQADIPITLVQRVYGQDALYPGQASINGHPEGYSPVTIPTDPTGKAVFTVVGVQSQREPVYFQALIHQAGAVPHGYSNQVSIQFIAKP